MVLETEIKFATEPPAFCSLMLDFQSTFSFSVSLSLFLACACLSREGRMEGGLPPGQSPDLLTPELVWDAEGLYHA